MRTLQRGLTLAAIAMSPLLQASEAEDIETLRQLDQAYAAEWMANNAQGVLELFTDDATLVPHHGDAPVVGKESIRRFWFDPSYAPTTVPEWDREPGEIVVLGDVGIVRGRARLVWEYEGVRTTIPEGNYVLIAVRTVRGWLIRMLTWNDDPRKWVREPVTGSE